MFFSRNLAYKIFIVLATYYANLCVFDNQAARRMLKSLKLYC